MQQPTPSPRRPGRLLTTEEWQRRERATHNAAGARRRLQTKESR
jgi:hypothetical protein